MHVTNETIIGLIKDAAAHFRSNIANRYTNRAISSVPMDNGMHSLVAMFTEHLEDYHLHGLDLEDLYVRLIAAAQLTQQLRMQVLPNIRRLVYADVPMGQTQPVDKVMRDMAIANFAPNLRIYCEKLAEIRTLAFAFEDSKNEGHHVPVRNHYPELSRIDEYLGLTGQ